jgi:hypothetical protein
MILSRDEERRDGGRQTVISQDPSWTHDKIPELVEEEE